MTSGHDHLRRELGAIEGETDDELAARGAGIIAIQRAVIARLRRAIGGVVDPLWHLIHEGEEEVMGEDVDDRSLE